MTAPDTLVLLGHERLAACATAPEAAWLWSPKGELLWANAQAGFVLGVRSRASLPDHPAIRSTGQQIERLAPSLPYSGSPRLERLRDLGEGIGGATVCRCMRIRFADHSSGVLAVSTERPKMPLSLIERAASLLTDVTRPVAAFAKDGGLLFCNEAAARQVGGASLSDLRIEALAGEALETGQASGETTRGKLAFTRLGQGASLVMLVEFPAHAGAQLTAPDVTPAPPAVPAAPVAEAHSHHPEPCSPKHSATDASLTGRDEAAAPKPDIPRLAPERRQPLRFVWQTDADGRFTLASSEFADLVAGETPRLLNRPWADIAAALALDPTSRVERAMASHDTFSGISVDWPTADATRVAVELSGLPAFDRNRAFCGYRGFGVCREWMRLAPAMPDAVAAAEEGPGTFESSPARPESRPALSVVPPAKNVVPFRGPTALDKRPLLTPVERTAFREIAKALGAKADSSETSVADPALQAEAAGTGEAGPGPADRLEAGEFIPSAFAPGATPLPAEPRWERHELISLLDRLPIGVFICRGNEMLYANRAALEGTGYPDLATVAADGGLDHILAMQEAAGGASGSGARLFTMTWGGETALMLVLAQLLAQPADKEPEHEESSARAVRLAEAETRELRSILDTATDGVIVIDRNGCVLSVNRSAEALFGYDAHEIIGQPFADLFAPESRRAALDYFDGLARNGVASLLNDGREVIGRVRQGGLVPLFMTLGCISEPGEKYCAVLRDITQWKRAEEELLNAKRLAEKSSSAKSDFLAKISHEIRTPLNAILGFSEVMIEQRFGPVGNERYRDYLRDIHASGEHLISLLNDLLDLSKIEAGKLDLKFASVRLNDLVQQCVALMQPQANRERIIIRTSLLPSLPPVVVDARSIRQIMLNLLSNSIKFTGAGGQVIVSTALTDLGEVVLRVRDTGPGMSDDDIGKAMEPFRQLPTSDRWGSGGTGLGLPLTKALAEANRASFSIKSALNAGTLIEITFPATRVLAE